MANHLFETLGDALEASVAAAKSQGIEVEFGLVTEGIGYGQARSWSLEPLNKPRSRKCWQVVISRMDSRDGPARMGRYELVNYFL